MSKLFSLFFTLVAIVVFIPGCSKYVKLEDHQISLVLGLDVDKRKNYLVYSASPIFDKQSPKKFNVNYAKTTTFQQVRDEFNNQSIGAHTIGKTQIILLGKKFLQQKNYLSYMDALFRDPKNEINAKMIAVDGDVNEIMYYKLNEKSQLGHVLNKLIENAYRNRTSVSTNLQQFYHQVSDRIVAPFLPEIDIDKNTISVKGTVILDKKGLYALHLNKQETSTLLLLLHDTREPIPITLHISSKTKDKQFVSFHIHREKFDMKVTYKEDHFVFATTMKLDVDITEQMFSMGSEQVEKEVKPLIEKELSRQCQDLILKLQKKGLDPIGLGNYARVQDYKHWKIEKDAWDQSLRKIETTVITKIKINSLGVSE